MVSLTLGCNPHDRNPQWGCPLTVSSSGLSSDPIKWDGSEGHLLTTLPTVCSRSSLGEEDTALPGGSQFLCVTWARKTPLGLFSFTGDIGEDRGRSVLSRPSYY